MKRRPIPSPLDRQVGRVCRRLFLQSMFSSILWSWAVALLLAAIWFLAQPYVWSSLPAFARVMVGGSVVACSTVAGLVAGLLRIPSRVAAALLLDEKFGLRERVTTVLTLSEEQKNTEAARALLADVNSRVDSLNVSSEFPVRVSWPTLLGPVAAALLAVTAFYLPVAQTQAKNLASEEKKQGPRNAAEIEKKMASLKKPFKENRPKDKQKSEELEKIQAELDRIANLPRKDKNDLRERMKDLTAVEDDVKNRQKELAEKNQALQHQLKQLDHMVQSESKDGPAKDFQKALSEGKFDKAKEELDRLVKKLEKNELSEKEKEKLSRQLQDIEKKLERLSQLKDKEEKLNQLAKEGKINAETLKREMKKLKEDSQKLKGMQDLAKSLQQAQKSLAQGDPKEAMERMKDAGEKLKDMGLDETEVADLQEELQKLQEAKDSVGEGSEISQKDASETGDQEEGEGMDGGGPPGQRRPVAPEKSFRSYDSKAKVELDKKGKMVFEKYVPGNNFQKKSSVEIAGDIKQASQEAPEAIEQQRIPKAARDMAKGYFHNLGGQQGISNKP